MKRKNKNFRIVTLSECADCPPRLQFDIFGIGSVIDGISSIFGGGSSSGLPGDYDNRVRVAHQKALAAGVKECVDYQQVELLITGTGIWQEKLDVYFNQLRNQKMTTGSCMPGQGVGDTVIKTIQANWIPYAVGAFAIGMLFSKQGKRRR